MSVDKSILDRIEHIQPLSLSAQRLMQRLSSEGADMDGLVHIVEHDPALTAGVLKVVNAPAFGLTGRIETVRRAVTYLGERLVLGIALGCAAPGIYDARLAAYEAGRGDLWMHCLRAALAARELARLSRPEVDGNLAFTCGLLHDIGKAVISLHMEPAVARKLRFLLTQADYRTFLDLERGLTGTDHAEVGAALAEHWRLPDSITAATRHHHAPEGAPEGHRALCRVAHLADALAMLGGTGTGVDTMRYAIEPEILGHFALDAESLDAVLLAVATQFDQARLLSVAAEA